MIHHKKHTNIRVFSILIPMQWKKYALKFMRSLITFMHVQLFITLVSMPILLYWGMPLSLLSFAGNFFFGPILTAFLFLSSIIFFCQLLGIPSGIFIFLLEKITHYWLSFMQIPSHAALIALPKPPFIFACCIALIAFGILHCKKIDTPLKGIGAYLALLLFSGIALAFSTKWAPSVQTLACNKGEVTIIYQKQLILIDPGFIGQRLSAPNWCEYTLMPHLAKEYGTTIIDHFIVLQPNGIVFDALVRLLGKITIKRIYLPVWQGTLPKQWWRHYFALLRQCQETGCTLIRMPNQGQRTLYLEKDTIAINALETTISSHEFLYSGYCVSGKVEGKEISIKSKKIDMK